MTESSHLIGPAVARLPAQSTVPDAIAQRLEGSGRIRFDSLDGLRGFACLMVVLIHAWGAFDKSRWPEVSLGRIHLSPAFIQERGFGGVDVFFVLSGFCLSFPIVSNPNRQTRWLRYFIARFRRIMLPYWSCLLMLVVAGAAIRHYDVYGLIPSPSPTWYGWHTLAKSALLIQYVYNDVFWTLLVEWRWYFVFPVLIAIWRRWGGSGVFGVAVVLASFYIIFLSPRDLPRLKYWMTRDVLKYMPLFAGGIWAAQMTASAAGRNLLERQLVKYAPIGVLLGLIVMCVVAPDDTKIVPRLLSFGVFAFFLVLAAVNNRTICRVFCFRPLVWVGIFSYSLYMTHEPLILDVASWLRKASPGPGLSLVYQWVLLPGIAVAFGYLFFLVAERPWLQKRRELRVAAPLSLQKA